MNKNFGNVKVVCFACKATVSLRHMQKHLGSEKCARAWWKQHRMPFTFGTVSSSDDCPRCGMSYSIPNDNAFKAAQKKIVEQKAYVSAPGLENLVLVVPKPEAASVN